MTQFAREKSQEIAFAVLRVAAYVRRFDLRKKLEELSYHLIENIHYGNHDLALSTIAVLDGFLLLSRNISELEPLNHKLISEQLAILHKEIREKTSSRPELNIASAFKSVKKEEVKEVINNRAEKNTAKQNRAEQDDNNGAKVNGAEQSGNNRAEELGDVLKGGAAMPTSLERQKRILELMRQSGKRVQLKDISSFFSGVSRRTLRYDLKQLCDRGELLREGKGGPSNFYRAKESVITL